MSDLFYLLSGAFLLIGAGAAGVTYRRNRAAGWLVAVLELFLAGLLLGGARLAGAVPAHLFAQETVTGAAVVVAGYVDSAAWQLTLTVLLLIVAVSLYRAGRAEASADGPDPARLLLLLFATLGVLWAGTLQTLILGWALLTVLWSLFLLRPVLTGATRAAGVYLLGAGWLSLFFLWLGAASLAIIAPTVAHQTGWETDRWPLITRSLLLAAALLQLGVYPLHLWRPLDQPLPPAAAAVVHTLPAAGGGLLLARLVGDSAVAHEFALPLTLVALLTLLIAAVRAWLRDGAQEIAALLVLAQAGMVLLAAVWGGAEATLAETRVLVLAGGLFFLLADRHGEPTPATHGSSRTQLIIQSASLFAVVTLAGLPPTAGFSGRAALYAAWLDSGRWLLLVVSAVLHLALITAALTMLRPLWATPAGGEDDALAASTVLPIAPAAAAGLLLPVAGLFSIYGLEALSPVTILVVVLPLVGAALLARLPARHPEALSDVTRVARDALRLQRPRVPMSSEQPLLSVGDAVRQAATLLEGEQGLLWLLLLLFLTWLTFFSV